jgi:predicted dehydrogenase
LKVLIIGLGSIAKKHIAALRSLNRDCEIYALRSSKSSQVIEGVRSCYTLEEVPLGLSFILISNPTSLHLKTIKEVSHFGVPLFIEKPPIDSVYQIRELAELIKTLDMPTYTAFNLRFHPVVQWLKDNIESHNVIEVNAYCGSYLPDWRPNKDYRKIYSAQKNLGGGVHLDLTHEIDFLLWIFGDPMSTMSTRRKISNLEIDSVDSAKYWLEYENFTISLTLNYFRRDSKRNVEIVTNQTTLECDLILNKITDLGKGQVIFESREFSSLDTYIEQMKYFIDCVETRTESMNTLLESMRTMEVCLT